MARRKSTLVSIYWHSLLCVLMTENDSGMISHVHTWNAQVTNWLVGWTIATQNNPEKYGKIWKNHDTSDITPPSLGTLSRSIMLQSQGVAFGKPTFHNIRHVHTRCLPSTSINIHQHPSTVNFAIFPLVNSHITMERSTIFFHILHGKIHYFDWAMFNSYVSLPYFIWENPLFLWPCHHFSWENPL